MSHKKSQNIKVGIMVENNVHVNIKLAVSLETVTVPVLYCLSSQDGLTPLHCGARSGHEQVVEMLLDRGAPILSKTKVHLRPVSLLSILVLLFYHALLLSVLPLLSLSFLIFTIFFNYVLSSLFICACFYLILQTLLSLVFAPERLVSPPHGDPGRPPQLRPAAAAPRGARGRRDQRLPDGAARGRPLRALQGGEGHRGQEG